ncbi:hypothetical protein M413DRAFT_260685 [Hebeloma cylindrosporum]|uniref:Uncharacterized protein n=1 Tax=Hebeloma cylindrosporum TaxID=76867 RepID=A0A0C3CRI5_HEBCY|nr:hypothetical protein M413DRAFT_260685 [Hebeloma cylindrosporum h7]
MQLQLQVQQQPPLPSPPIIMRLNLAGVHGAFSPGVSMSPGTFYGRPGDVPGPNPHINAAVGAPVHVVQMHSPLGMVRMQQQQQQGQGQGQGGPMPPPHGGHPTHGAYFYAMSSPKKGPPTGMEPQGYFDPMHFPVGAVLPGVVNDAEGGMQMQSQSQSQALQTSGLANEVVQDGVEKEKERERKRVEEEELEGGGRGGGENKKDAGSIEKSTSLPDGKIDSVTAGLSSAGIDAAISRTHSLGHTEEPASKLVPEHGLVTMVDILDLELPEQQQPPALGSSA